MSKKRSTVKTMGVDDGYQATKRGGEDKSALVAALQFGPGAQKRSRTATASLPNAEPY